MLRRLKWALSLFPKIEEDSGNVLTRNVLTALWKFQITGKSGYLRLDIFPSPFLSFGRLSSLLGNRAWRFAVAACC